MLFIFVAISALFVPFSSGTFLENTLEYIQKDYGGPHGMDPFRLKKEFEVDRPLLNLLVSFDALIKGFTDYDIYQADLTPDLKLTLNVSLKDTKIYGTYKANGTYYKVLPIKGDGNFLIGLLNFGFYLDTVISPKNGSIQLLSFDMNYSFDDLLVNISGLSGQKDVGDLIQHFIKDLLPNTLSTKRKEIIKFINHFAITTGNTLIKTFSPRTAIEIMKILFIY